VCSSSSRARYSSKVLTGLVPIPLHDELLHALRHAFTRGPQLLQCSSNCYGPIHAALLLAHLQMKHGPPLNKNHMTLITPFCCRTSPISDLCTAEGCWMNQ
jgi:hypothetical protein